LIEHGAWRGPVRGKHLKQECQAEENPAAPPARLRQEVACLTSTDERVGGCTDTTEARRQASAFACLKQDGGDKNDAVEDEENEKKREHQKELVVRG
jgi:hypothetical protein